MGMSVFKKSLKFLLIAFSLVIWACRYPATSTVPGEIKNSFVAQSLVDTPREVFLPAFDTSQSLYKGLNRQASVLEFYKMMNYKPVWLDTRFQSGTPLADSLAVLVNNIRYYGLLPGNYHVEELVAEGDSSRSQPTRLRREVLLTDAFLSIAKDLRFGRLGRADAGDDSVQRLLLLRLLEQGGLTSHLESEEPSVSYYQALKLQLKYLLDSTDAVQRTLLLKGVTVDSVGLHRRVRSVEINMERWKWEKRDLGHRYMIVNIPSFMARVVAGDIVVLESSVIVGKSQNPTPELSSVIECFITYPYWHVPRKIAVDELLPLIRGDNGYIDRHHFDVLDRNGHLLNPDSVRWERFDRNYFPVTLRQREGPENSLGILKFIFDNPYAVFLHDTNAPRLFRSKVRAFSHGCIRMEEARRFAHYLLTGDPAIRSATLDKYLKQATRHSVDVPNPVPIYVRYFTAEVQEGRLHIFNDLYGKDRSLINRLYLRQPKYYY